MRQRPIQEFERHVFDGRLLDELKTLLPVNVSEELVRSCKDARCTKQFQNREPMMETSRLFATTERNDGRHSKAIRAAIVLLEKYLLPNARCVRMDYHGEGWRELLSNEEGAAGIIAVGSKAGNIEYEIELADRITEMVSSGVRFSEISIPAKCFHRAQISNYVSSDGSHYDGSEIKRKDRLVMGVDGATVLVEASYFKPIYNLLKTRWPNYAGGKEPHELRHQMQSWRINSYWLGLDYSKFDMHVPSWLIYECFNILKRKYFDESDWRLFDWIAYNFVNTQFQLPDGTYGFKKHGIPSGSNGTQPIGSMCNAIMTISGLMSQSGCRTAHEMVDWALKVLRPQHYAGEEVIAASFMGDDGLIFSTFPMTERVLDGMSKYIFDKFGVEMNVDKSASGFGLQDNPQYLKREWRRGGEYQNPIQLFVNVVHNERSRDYDGYEPIHIIYGLWYCYKATFDSLGIRENVLVDKLRRSQHGISALLRIPLHERPGVFRGAGENMMRTLHRRVERLVAKLPPVA